jgi:hypothetical protein
MAATSGQYHPHVLISACPFKFLCAHDDKAISKVMHTKREAMEYSVNQINNLLRTYPQHLKVRPTLRDKETHTSYDPSSVDHVSISPEGRRRLEAKTTHSVSGS